MNEGVVAFLFYLSVAALVFGLIRALRASIERHVRDIPAIMLAGAGVIGLIAAVVFFVNGTRGVLPF